MWIMVVLLFLSVIVMGICLYQEKTTYETCERKIIYDEGEFYRTLAENVPEDEHIHKITGDEKQHVIIVDEYVFRTKLFDKDFEKLKSHKHYCEYYIP